MRYRCAIVLHRETSISGSWETDFRIVLDKFDHDQFTIVCWDPPGFGKSRPPDRDFSPGYNARDAAKAFKLMHVIRDVWLTNCNVESRAFFRRLTCFRFRCSDGATAALPHWISLSSSVIPIMSTSWSFGVRPVTLRRKWLWFIEVPTDFLFASVAWPTLDRRRIAECLNRKH